MKNRKNSSLPLVVGILACLWMAHTLTQYFFRGLDKSRFLREKLAAGFEPWSGWKVILMVHAGMACVAIAAALCSFALADKAKWQLHRAFGITYVLAVLISATAGFPMAFTATGGAWAVSAFLVLNAAWLITTLVAWRAARTRLIQAHRVWVSRSFAITLANTTLHILTPLIQAAGFGRITAYVMAAWFCWPLNLTVYEAARFFRGLHRKKAKVGTL